MLLAVRLHEQNSWVLDRLVMHAEWYDPRPRIRVVDFGSEGAFAEQIARVCTQYGMELLRVDDTDTYSPARARNVGFVATDTPLVYFNDVDCFTARDHFAHLVRVANALGMGSHSDQMINLPVVHLSHEATAELASLGSAEAQSAALHRLSIEALVDDFGGIADFVAPYSNIFLCHRDFFDMVGGYDEGFRGHGSEDFEFLLRFVHYAGGFPIPDEAGKDAYSPMKEEFFGAKSYRGFRRLFEVLAFTAEVEGLRTVHLHHPKPAEAKWYRKNDWRRSRFNDCVNAYLEKPSVLLERDWLPRRRKCLVLMKHEDHAAFYPPLRLGGYRLELLDLDDPKKLARAVDRLEGGEFDAIALFNPYMQSHTELRPYFELGKKCGAEPIVVERGALPESWYYAPSVSYCDPEFLEMEVAKLDVTTQELEIASEYRRELATGRSALEHQEDPEETAARLKVHTRFAPKRVLVPLQLDDDMAVTRFTDGFPSYSEYKRELFEGFEAHEDVLFFVKPHPLSKGDMAIPAPNVIPCTGGENIHALIDAVDAVICYNSGVGLLAALQGKRVITFGNAFYNRPGIGQRARTLAEALERAFDESWTPADAALDRLTAWLIFHKYSFCKAKSIIRDFEERRSHGYREQHFYRVKAPGGVDVSWCRASADRPIGHRSYAAARLGIGIEAEAPPKPVPSRTRRERTVRKMRKLVRDPKRFFADSKRSVLRSFGSRLFK